MSPRRQGPRRRALAVTPAQVADTRSEVEGCRGPGKAPRPAQAAARGGRLGGNANAAPVAPHADPLDSRLRGNDSPFLAVTPAQVADTRSEVEGCRGPGKAPRPAQDATAEQDRLRGNASPACHRPAAEIPLDSRLRGNDNLFSGRRRCTNRGRPEPSDGVQGSRRCARLSPLRKSRHSERRYAGVQATCRRQGRPTAEQDRLRGNANAAQPTPGAELPGFPHPSASLRASSTCAGMTTSSRPSPLHKSQTPGARRWCAGVWARRHVERSRQRENPPAGECRRWRISRRSDGGAW